MSGTSDIWKRARKKPLLVQYREVRGGKDGDKEFIKTREGTLVAVRGKDFVIRGTEGELYPITKTTFFKTYEIIGEKPEPPTDASGCPPDFNPFTNCNEQCPKWRCW